MTSIYFQDAENIFVPGNDLGVAHVNTPMSPLMLM